MDLELELHGVGTSMQGDGRGLLQSLGSFLKDGFSDILLVPEHSAPLRSSSCPRGRATTAANASLPPPATPPTDSSWRWESPTRTNRPLSVSLHASPESPGVRRNTLLDMVAGISQQATAFLDRLDANFEQIFKAEDEPELNSTAGSATQLHPQAAAVPGARTSALATRQSATSKGGKATKGRLGANRLGTGCQAPSAAAGSMLSEAARSRRAQASSAAPAHPQAVSQFHSPTGKPAATAPEQHPEPLTGGDAEVLIDVRQPSKPPPLATAEVRSPLQGSPCAVKGHPCKPDPAEAPPESTHSPATTMASRQAQSVQQSPPPEGNASPSTSGSSLPRVLTAADRRRCIKALLQEVASLKAERRELQAQAQEAAVLRQQHEELQAQVGQLTQENSQLVEENARLLCRVSTSGCQNSDPMAEEAVVRQMQSLLVDKTRLAEDNQRLASQNQMLHALLSFTAEHSQLADSASEWPSPSSGLLSLSGPQDDLGCDEGQLACIWHKGGESPRSVHKETWPEQAASQASGELAEITAIRQQFDELFSTSASGPTFLMHSLNEDSPSSYAAAVGV